jgi:signal transduction histidine kinase
VAIIEVATVAFSFGNHWRDPTGSQLILILAGSGTLLLRLRYPALVTVATVVCGVAFPMVAPHMVIFNAASVVALFTLATLGDRRLTWGAGVAAVVGLSISSALWLPGHLLNIRTLLPANYIVIAVAVGDAARSRRIVLIQAQERAEQAERTREEEARHRVQEERVRIARDLHDVVAHHITLVNAQAGVAYHLFRHNPEKAHQALADIRETSRTALDELRSTVGLLRQDNDPPPSLQPAPAFELLDDLLTSFRATGFDLRITRQGVQRPLGGGADLAAYRIAQEALTNVSKHSTSPQADISVTYEDTVLRLSISNPAQGGHRGGGSGHGLIGMRERAEAAGGTFDARARADGCFVVTVTLPLRSTDPNEA